MKEINFNTKVKKYSYPSIEQFRNVVHKVKWKTQYVGSDLDGEPIFDETIKLPTIRFLGSVKMHGCNGSVVFDRIENITYFQSREVVLSPSKDNAGFVSYMSSIQSPLVDLFSDIIGDIVIVYGEWCGGNIQKNVAISNLDKMFVIFDIKVFNGADFHWMSYDAVKNYKNEALRVYNILDFQTWYIDVDFSNPSDCSQKMTEITNAVEAMCPVGKQLGSEGIGEGVVYKPVDSVYFGEDFFFKIKGEKHAVVKSSNLAAVDVEKISNAKQFVETYVTENRCQQGLSKLRELGDDLIIQNTGKFINWIKNDIIKEEMDTIKANGFDEKTLTPHISTVARKWYMDTMDKASGIISK